VQMHAFLALLVKSPYELLRVSEASVDLFGGILKENHFALLGVIPACSLTAKCRYLTLQSRALCLLVLTKLPGSLFLAGGGGMLGPWVLVCSQVTISFPWWILNWVLVVIW
jgi:hypothetical protein